MYPPPPYPSPPYTLPSYPPPDTVLEGIPFGYLLLGWLLVIVLQAAVLWLLYRWRKNFSGLAHGWFAPRVSPVDKDGLESHSLVSFSVDLAAGERIRVTLEGLPAVQDSEHIEAGDAVPLEVVSSLQEVTVTEIPAVDIPAAEMPVVEIPVVEAQPLDPAEVLKEQADAVRGYLDNLKDRLTSRSWRFPMTLSREKLLVAILVGVIFLLALLPPSLVVAHRWLDPSAPFAIVEKIGPQWSLLRQRGYPYYFPFVFNCVLVLSILVWLARRTALLSTVTAFEEAAALPAAGSGPQSSFRRKWGTWLVVGAAVAGLLVTAWGISGGLATGVPGWAYIIVLVVYGLGWLLRENSVVTTSYVLDIWQPGLAFLLAHFALLGLLASLYGSQSHLWVAGLLFAVAAANLARYYRRIPPILWVMTLALVLYTLYIDSWAFAVVGDEYSFFNAALDLVEKRDWVYIGAHLFDGQAVYGTHPFFSSFLQMLSMKLFGVTNFGWRFLNPYLSALSIGLFYLFFRGFVDRRTSYLATLLLAASHYVMSFSKIGYNNLQALFTLGLALAACAWAVRSRRNLAYVALGLSLGLCFYVYPAALYGLAAVTLLLLFCDFPGSKAAWRRWGLVVLSLGMLLLPLLLQPAYWQAKFPGTLFNNPEITATSGTVLAHLAWNLSFAFSSFLYVPQEDHFVIVSYTDPLTASFILIGLIYLLGMLFLTPRSQRSRWGAFVLVSFLVMLFLVGASHDRMYPPTTRMFLLLPWFALLGAFGLRWALAAINALRVSHTVQKILLSGLLVGVFALNLYQAYPLSIRRSAGLQSPEVLFLRLVNFIQQREVGVHLPRTFLFVTTSNWGIDGFHLLQLIYGIPVSQVKLERVVTDDPELPVEALPLLQQPRTLVIIYPETKDQRQQALYALMEEQGKSPCDVTAVNGDHRFTLWASSEMTWVCEVSP